MPQVISPFFIKGDSMDHNTTITYKDRFGVYSITKNREFTSISDVLDELIVPLLIGMGFCKDTVFEAKNELLEDFNGNGDNL